MAAAPIAPISQALILVCALVLPLAAFTAAIPRRGKRYNIIGFVLGLIAITVLGAVLYQYH